MLATDELYGLRKLGRMNVSGDHLPAKCDINPIEVLFGSINVKLDVYAIADVKTHIGNTFIIGLGLESYRKNDVIARITLNGIE